MGINGPSEGIDEITDKLEDQLAHEFLTRESSTDEIESKLESMQEIAILLEDADKNGIDLSERLEDDLINGIVNFNGDEKVILNLESEGHEVWTDAEEIYESFEEAVDLHFKDWGGGFESY